MQKAQPLRRLVPKLLTAVVTVTVAQLLAPQHASAQDTARRFFEGKRVSILVGFPPAGSHDLEARVIARHIPKYLPGNPTVLVRNMPGASADIMMTHLYKREKPNGLAVGIAGSGQKLGAPGGREIVYDLTKMPLLWAVSQTTVHFVRDFLNAKSARDLLKVDPAQIVVAGRSAVDLSCANGRLALDLLGIDGYKPVCRYPGIAIIKAAMERGEVSYFASGESSLMAGGIFAEMAAKGMVITLWQHGRPTPDGKIARSPTVAPDVPTLFEVYEDIHGRPPGGVMWEAAWAVGPKLDTLTRTYHLPPGTPNNIVATWRQAMARLERDPDFVAEWERIFGQELAPVVVPPEESEPLLLEYFTPQPWHEFFRKFVAALAR